MSRAIAVPTPGEDPARPPERVSVLPVFFVPDDQDPPTHDQVHRLDRHLRWARQRYREMLDGDTTFQLADRPPLILRGTEDLAFYRAQPESAAPRMLSETLDALGYSRFNCPYVLVTVLCNPNDNFPGGGGRPINSGLNTGGGIVILSLYAMDRLPNFQSTLQHELGHAFGLPHVDAYGYNMAANDSIMSYNQEHHTRYFEPSPAPGRLIAEDRRALALNQRVFPGLTFDPQTLASYEPLSDHIAVFPPMTIPGQPAGVHVAADVGSRYGSEPSHIVHRRIAENTPGPEARPRFDPADAWHSEPLPDGRARLTVTFPYEVKLSGAVLHTEHSGRYHRAHGVEVERSQPSAPPSRRWQQVARASLDAADTRLNWPASSARQWRFALLTEPGQPVVVRGLRFFDGDTEIFPPPIPHPVPPAR